MDHYGHKILWGMKYLKGYFLEQKHHPATYFRISESQKLSINSISEKATYYQSIVYPYVIHYTKNEVFHYRFLQ